MKTHHFNLFMEKLTLKQQLLQLDHVADVLAEDHPEHSSELQDIQKEIHSVLVDILEPSGKDLAKALIARTQPRFDSIAQEEKCPDTEPSPYSYEDVSYPPTTFILPPDEI